MSVVQDNVGQVTKRIALAKEAAISRSAPRVRLVCVSKFKPAECVLEAYRCGQRHFGENYVQELIDKSNNEQIVVHCPDIQWHMIGHLQGNKVNKLIDNAHRLHTIETVDSVKLAHALNKAVARRRDLPFDKLNVMVQVNTSEEQQKSGTNASEAIRLAELIMQQCSNLKFAGFMTIGSLESSCNVEPNREFQRLVEVRQLFCRELNVPVDQVELSMGMSHDFEHAISMGSTNVRVGSAIFGPRDVKN